MRCWVGSVLLIALVAGSQPGCSEGTDAIRGGPHHPSQGGHGGSPGAGDRGGSPGAGDSSLDPDLLVRPSGRGLISGPGAAEFRPVGVTFNDYYWAPGSTIRDGDHHALADYQRVADLGMNTVQLMLSYRIFESDDAPLVYLDAGWRWLDENIAAARDAGLLVILDLVTAAGADWHDQSAGAPDLRFWTEPDYQQRYLALWEAIARRYANHPTVLAYGLLSEPVTEDATGAQWWNLFEAARRRVRSVDPHHLIIADPLMGTRGEYSVPASVERRRVIDDARVVYDIHFYEPYEFTHQGATWTPVELGPVTYPDPTALTLVGDLVHRHSTQDNPALPPGDSDWALYEGVPYLVTDPDLAASYPTVQCQGDNTGGVAQFDELVVREYDADGELLRVLGDTSVTEDSSWYPYPSDLDDVLHRDADGHADPQSLVISSSTDTALFSTRQIFFRVSEGNQYQISGWMRGTGIQPSAECRFTLELYELDEGASLSGRDRGTITALLDEALSFGAEHDVPMLVTEFGMTRDALAADRGGLRWLDDVVGAFDERDLGYVFYTYHSDTMGLYGNEGELPSENNAEDALLDFFRGHLR